MFGLLLALLIAVPRTLGVIQINQGATKAEVLLARQYKSFEDFRKDLMGKNKCHNLDFSKITADEIGHLPKEIYSRLNEVQARQIIDRYQEELAKGINPVSFLNAMKEIFASKTAVDERKLDWLTEKDIDIFGFVPLFMPIDELPKSLYVHIIDRWSKSNISPAIRRELQFVNLKDLVENKHFETAKMSKKFFKNLHSQVTFEHWPKCLQNKSSKNGAPSSELNKDLGVSSSSQGSTDDSTDRSYDSGTSSSSTEETTSGRSRQRRRRNDRKPSLSIKPRRRNRDRGRASSINNIRTVDRNTMRRATALLAARRRG